MRVKFYTFQFQTFTMRHEELFYLLALTKTEGIGDVIAKKLLSHFGSAESALKANMRQLSRVPGVGHILAANLKHRSVFEKAEAELEFINYRNIRAVCFQDDEYPERLRHCPDGPVLLFSTGNISLRGRKIISIVGTRQMTAYGAEVCRNLISDLAPLNPVIVSGFAYGVDIAAHQAAVDNGLQTIGVLAHGLNQIYPKLHRKYLQKVEENGGFLTEFWSSSEPDRENFLKRNRIVAGMSEATIVIESAEKGGSLVTANIANDYNRDVFAVPGRISDRYSAGCNNLIKTQKANPLTSAADLVYMLNWDIESKPKAVQKQLFVSLENDEQKIYDYLHHNGRQLLDTIAIECGFPVFRMSSMLLNMELKGVVRPLPGKMFEMI
jgi:DNA processing protein